MWVPLIDVSETSMAEIIASQDTILSRCIDRLIASLDDSDGIISAFQSIVDDIAMPPGVSGFSSHIV